MVINGEQNGNVKFVSYSGKYPNLCGGILVLDVKGKKYTFGGYGSGHFRSFWSSGGGCGFSKNYNDSYVNHGEWRIDVARLPKELEEYANEIDEALNKNVSFGCCGGCL